MPITEVQSPEVTTEPDMASRILERAAELIEERGWFRYDTNGSELCAGLAINVAQLSFKGTTTFDNLSARVKLNKYLGLDHDIHSAPLSEWNDAQTDARVVIRALREAAAS